MGTSMTPTPWRVFTTTDGRKLIGVGDQDGQGILDCGFGVWSWNDAEGIANAELVVRAVNAHDDLVRALKEIVAAHSLANIGLGASRRRLFAIKSARAAIAKAKGAA